jgi:signal transduction histidine kinase
MTSDIDHSSEHDRYRPLSGRELLGIFAFWTFMALLAAANEVVDPRAADAAGWSGFGKPVLLEFFEAYLWAALTPVIFWLSGRLSFERGRWVGPALLLAAVALACSVLTDVADDFVQIRVLGLPGNPEAISPVSSVLHFWFANDLMIFLAVLAAGFARVYFLRYRARQEQAGRLQARAALLEAQLAEARLDALRMQVNPHFLFNTLHAISTLVDRDPDGVRRMIAKLAGLLRTTLGDGGDPEVALERELEFLEDYLEIMQVRFQGRLEVDFRIDPGLLDAKVPNLILQPLLENALKHAVGESETLVRVQVRGDARAGDLLLSVSDTGPGFPGDGDGPTPGIGLRNVRERLAQLYGDEADLRLESRPGGGARAVIRLPLRHVEPRSGDAQALALTEVP